MEVFGPLFLTVAVSIDSLGVGITYGLRQVRFAPWSLVIIGLCTLGLMGTAMIFGRFFQHLIPQHLGGMIGGLILIGIGLWHTLRYLKEAKAGKRATAKAPHGEEGQTAAAAGDDSVETSNILTAFRLPYLGIMIQILHDPTQADADASSSIDVREAFVLGLALGMDAFGAGFGAAVAGFSFVMIPLVAAASILFLVLGCTLGHWRVLQIAGQNFIFLPGMLLMGLGLLQLL